LPGPRTFLAIPIEAWPAVVVQAVVFASLRYLPVDAPLEAALVGGIAAGWITVRTGSVWPAVFVRLTTSHLVFVGLQLLGP
jgi:membrane protease YdiL (CAAX protease family)